LLVFLGLVRRKRAIPHKVRRILMLQTAAIGDSLFMAASIKWLRVRYPDASLILAGGPSNIAAVDILPRVDEVLRVDVLHPVDALRALRGAKADVLVDYGPWPRINAVLAALSGAAFTIGFKTKGQLRHFAYDATVEHSPCQHELFNHRELLSYFGDVSKWDAELVAPGADASSQVTLPPRPYALFHPWASGSGKEFKEWPVDRWIELARMAAEQGLAIIVSGASQDSASSARLCEAIIAAGGRTKVLSLAGEVSLRELANVISDSVGVVSVNTGIMHLAAMLGAPTVGISGPTNPARWGPVGPRAVSVHPDCPDCGYLNLGFEFPRNPPDCMGRIGVADVWAAFRKVAGI
jgi:heptosyltransferase-3